MAKNEDQERKPTSGESTSPADAGRAAGEGSAAEERQRSRGEQLRAAVEGAFGATAQGAAPVQKRAAELADELVGAASRVREVLEELRPPSPDELQALRDQVAGLERRVAELEDAAAAKPKPKRAARPTATDKGGGAAKRPPAGGSRS
jgi:polyhydroxyalkanoate synthesis regulator phasin